MDSRRITLLLFMVVAVPANVVVALVAAVLLARAGFGIAVWALVPFGVSMALILALGIVLGRAAARSADGGPNGGPNGERRSDKDDGV